MAPQSGSRRGACLAGRTGSSRARIFFALRCWTHDMRRHAMHEPQCDSRIACEGNQ